MSRSRAVRCRDIGTVYYWYYYWFSPEVFATSQQTDDRTGTDYVRKRHFRELFQTNRPSETRSARVVDGVLVPHPPNKSGFRRAKFLVLSLRETRTQLSFTKCCEPHNDCFYIDGLRRLILNIFIRPKIRHRDVDNKKWKPFTVRRKFVIVSDQSWTTAGHSCNWNSVERSWRTRSRTINYQITCFRSRFFDKYKRFFFFKYNTLKCLSIDTTLFDIDKCKRYSLISFSNVVICRRVIRNDYYVRVECVFIVLFYWSIKTLTTKSFG